MIIDKHGAQEEYLKSEIKHYQALVEFACDEVNAGNSRMKSSLEVYANHRDSLKIQLSALNNTL